MDPLLFSQLCVFHYTEVRKPTVSEINEQGQIYRVHHHQLNWWSVSRRTQKVNSTSDWCLGTVIINKNHQWICVPGNSTITLPGHTNKLKHQKEPVLVGQTRHHNLPNGMSINSCYAKPKNRIIPIISMNTSTENIWIKQPLLAAEIYQVNFHPWQYFTLMDWQSSTIKMRFQPIPSAEIKAELNQIGANEDSQGIGCQRDLMTFSLNLVQSQTWERI